MHNKADMAQRQQIADVLNAFPFVTAIYQVSGHGFGEAATENLNKLNVPYVSSEGHFGCKGKTGIPVKENRNAFTAENICKFCDYLATSSDKQSKIKCSS